MGDCIKAPPSKRRKLTKTLSDAYGQLEVERDSLSRTEYYRRRLDIVKQPHRIEADQRSKRAAIAQWDRDSHKGLFMTTIILRMIFSKIRKMRKDAPSYYVKINGRWIQQSRLFARVGSEVGANEIRSLISAMGPMHLHNVFAGDDAFHQSMKPLLLKGKNVEQKIRLLNFSMEFQFLVRMEARPAKLLHYCTLACSEPMEFARAMRSSHLMPVSPRFGQGDNQKSWYCNLLSYAQSKDWDSWDALVVRICQERLFSDGELRVLASILALAPSHTMDRMSLYRAAMGSAAFRRKNYLEAFLVHGLWSDVSDPELAGIDNGPGARELFKLTGLSRPELVGAMAELCDDLVKVEVYEKASGWCYAYTPQALGLRRSAITEAVVQFWSCAQGPLITP